MSTVYTGDETNDPASITIPSDGDGPGIKAADVNVAFEGLADQVAAKKMRVDTFPADGTWTCPTNVTEILLVGCGGGGGGGKGQVGSTSDDNYPCSGAGGGAAQERVVPLTVTPGVLYTVVIGAGGAGSTSVGTFGHGDPTQFKQGAVVQASFRGASGGAGGNTYGDATDAVIVSSGAPTEKSGFQGQTIKYVASDAFHVPPRYAFGSGPGFGGEGQDRHSSGAGRGVGWDSIRGYSGGAAGAHGTDSVLKRGGGGGGGGAASVFGNGAAGGAGGNGNSAGAGVAGSNGANAASAGAGGGGGGAGGSGTSGGAGGNGGDGGDGLLQVIYVGKQALVT